MDKKDIEKLGLSDAGIKANIEYYEGLEKKHEAQKYVNGIWKQFWMQILRDKNA